MPLCQIPAELLPAKILLSQAKKKQESVYIFEQSYVIPFKLGDYGYKIKKLNTLLKKLLDYFNIHHVLRENEFFSVQTESAVDTARTIFGLGKGEADIIFLQRLIKEINSINKNLLH